MFPILQFHEHLFHAHLAWRWRRILPRRTGLAWCPLVPEWAQLTRFLPSVKSAVFWIQVEVWECLATWAGIVLLCPCLRYHKWAAFPNRKLPLNACLTRSGRPAGGQASTGDTRQVCHLWWCLQRLSDEQQGDQMLPQSTSAQNNCWVHKWVGTSLPRPPGCCQSTTSIWWPTLLLSQHCLLPPLSQFLADAIWGIPEVRVWCSFPPGAWGLGLPLCTHHDNSTEVDCLPLSLWSRRTRWAAKCRHPVRDVEMSPPGMSVGHQPFGVCLSLRGLPPPRPRAHPMTEGRCRKAWLFGPTLMGLLILFAFTSFHRCQSYRHSPQNKSLNSVSESVSKECSLQLMNLSWSLTNEEFCDLGEARTYFL